MLKARGLTPTGEPVLLIGLSSENLRRLKHNEPIRFKLSELNLGPGEVLIMAGRTERELAKKLGLRMPKNGETKQ